MKLTIAQVSATLKPYGMTVTKKDGEYLVRIKGTPSGAGYFTTDLKDASDTGIDMAIRAGLLRKDVSEPENV